MIKLEKNLSPLFLNPSVVVTLTNTFKTHETSVWNIDEIKEPLLELSYGKCAYCECDLREESKYMEVEHFEDKKNNPDKVVVWDNLLPSCKRCNGAKSTHDVISNPIINPFLENPVNHLKLTHYRFIGTTNVGTETIGVVDLNHTERAVNKRFKIGNKLLETIEVLGEKLQLYLDKPITQRKNKLLGVLEAILLECQEYAEYTATTSTILHSSVKFQEIKIEVETAGLWSQRFDDLFTNSKRFIL
ncbi:HNH endonuclease [Mucilaginibacter sp. CAU 1740]|uniref:HNH endonuclease n=1 Tax=Mucilaginibacter sp. CAU 1740 TaxID=3140365 RepID=UPI00325C29EC